MSQSIYDRYGVAQVSQMISKFYSAVLDSPRLGPYFEGVDMQTLVDHQSAFMVTAMGGPISFSDDDLRVAHARLRVTPEDFAEMMRFLRDTLERFRVDPAGIDQILARYEGTRESIVADQGQ